MKNFFIPKNRGGHYQAILTIPLMSSKKTINNQEVLGNMRLRGQGHVSLHLYALPRLEEPTMLSVEGHGNW